MSTIPPSAQQAAQNALNAVIDADSSRNDSSTSRVPGEDDAGQVLELNSNPPADVDRTVFEDPKSFNVKVRFRGSSSFIAHCYQCPHCVAPTLLFMDVVVRFAND